MTKLRQLFDKFLNKSSVTNNTNDAGKNRWFSWRDLMIIIAIMIGIHFWQVKDSLPTDGANTAPSFVLPSLSGQIIDSNNKAAVPSIYYFFAPWCNICHLSIENINTLKQDINNKNVNVYIIALDWKTVDEVKQFVSEHDLPVDVLLGTVQQLKDFNIKGFPTYYISNSNDQLEFVSVGYSTSLGMKSRLALIE